MNGIDVSSWQRGIDLEKVEADFVIMKATEGVNYTSPEMRGFYNAAKASGKLRGLYHFASGAPTARAEAEYFLKIVRDYVGDAVLVLDWEADALAKGAGYAGEFLDTVYEKTGVRPLIYMSKSVCSAYDWSGVAKNYGLWVAQYASMAIVNGYLENPWTDGKGYGAWKSPVIFQYSSTGRLRGYGGNLDLNKAYLTPDQWTALASGTQRRENMEELVDEVLEGKWGNGDERKRALTAAGYDYESVQNAVNRRLNSDAVKAVAQEVIAGKWGNGQERRTRLTEAGYDYQDVQNEVNKLIERE